MEIGTWGEWIGSVAAITGAFVSFAALLLARSANNIAVRAEESLAKRIEEDRRIAETVGLQAWWATRDGEWGVFIEINGDKQGLITDVKITVQTKNGEKTHRVERLPRGGYWLASTKPRVDDPAGYHNEWGRILPLSEENYRELTPVLYAHSYQVTSIEYTDLKGYRWRWTESDGATRIQDVSNPRLSE